MALVAAANLLSYTHDNTPLPLPHDASRAALSSSERASDPRAVRTSPGGLLKRSPC